jgi:ubiquitin-conjugating enzyme E2 Q
MGRKDFIADVQGASELAIPGISLVARGDDDGEVNVCFVPASGTPIELSMLAQPGMSPDPHYIAFVFCVFASISSASIPLPHSWHSGTSKYSLLRS